METISAFKGINNVSDPMRLGMKWLAQADNVNISDTGAISKREGYALNRAGAFTGAYNTLDFSRLYLATDSTIQDFVGTIIYTMLAPGKTVHWCEINEQVFFNNGVDTGIILPDNSIIPWGWTAPTAPSVAAVTGNLPAGLYQVRCTATLPDGRETGASEAAEITLAEGQSLQLSGLTPGNNIYITPANSEVYQLAGRATSSAFTFNASPDALGRDLLNNFLDPLPFGSDVIQAWRGRVYASSYMASENQSVVWFSEALGYHLFNLNQNYIIVPGKVEMLAPHDSALVIGTDAKVFAYDGQKLDTLADYGVVAGQHWARYDSSILFWSLRGLCAFAPFANLTEKQISVAPGIRAGGCLVRQDGQARYVASLQTGGTAFNSL